MCSAIRTNSLLPAEVWTEYSRTTVAVRSFGDKIAMFDCTGKQISKVIKLMHASDTAYIAIDQLKEIVYIGLWRKKTVEAIHWPTSTQLWVSNNHKQIYTLATHPLGVFVQYHSAKCSVLDYALGERIVTFNGVQNFHVDSIRAEFVLARGRGFTSGHKTIELHTSLEGPAEWNDPNPLPETLASAFGVGWIALSQAGSGVIRAYSRSGEVLWNFVDDTCFFPTLIVNHDRNTLIAIMRYSTSRAGTNFIEFDAFTGEIVHKSAIEHDKIATNPCMNNSALLCRDGLLRLPSLKWEPLDFALKHT